MILVGLLLFAVVFLGVGWAVSTEMFQHRAWRRRVESGDTDIVAALAAIPGDRVLVTTPFHLRTLLAVPGPMPAVRMIVSATAPLSPQVAREVEDRFAAPLLEIYGCTEAGQLATRRPVEGDLWQTFRGVTIATGLDADGDAAWFAAGGHIETPTALSDVLVLETPEWFRLLGRGADMVNVAGKRASLAHLNHLLCEIPGVVDGAHTLKFIASAVESAKTGTT